MKKALLFITGIVLSCTAMFATSVTMSDAEAVATNYYKHIALSAVSDYSISDEFETKYNGITTYYTFTFASGGFVMVAADDAVIPVIGYSNEGSFDKNNVPPSAQNFFESKSKEIVKILDAKLSNVETKPQWDVIRNENYGKAPQTIVGPLCTTTWDQSSPYSNLCPSGTVTGCVATAMAQIMKFWNWPATGVGSNTYYATYPAANLTANFGTTTYDWTNMTNTYSGASSAASKLAVATLMFDCGVSVNMDYEPAATGGSAAYSTNVPPALINHFQYQPTAQVKERASFTSDAAWLTMLEEEINEGRPVSLTGDNAGMAGSGHQWVSDGYNSITSFFHMNWGWSGSSNG
jgi:hypothetical protein